MKKPPVSCRWGYMRMLTYIRSRISQYQSQINVPPFQAEDFCRWPMTPRETRCTLSTRKRGDVVVVRLKVFQVAADSRKPFRKARAADERRERLGYLNQLKT